MNLKELSTREDRLAPGHRLCPGCAASIIARIVMLSTDKPIVATCATGCLEVSTTIYPYTAWKVPWMHNAFENSAATLSGIETAYQVMKKKGKIQKDIKFLAFGGDGGTYDIGLQSLSGTLERGHDVVYVCYDNEAYMNCLSLDTHVMTKGGLKKVTDIKLGEKVYAFNQKNGNLVLKGCTGIYDNGINKVYEVNTRHHSIKATANHPFLIVKRQGRGKKTVLEWKTLEKLQVKDEVVVLKNYIAFSKKRAPNIAKYASQIKQRDFLADNEFFSTEKITSISFVKEEPTIDLRVEGEHNFIADGIVVHNTGVQRSSSTPYGTDTKTTPPGKASFGKDQYKKDLTAVVAGHHIPYVAQASPHNYNDLLRKAEKAFETKGPAFLNVISPCVPGWGYPSEKSLTMAKLAVETCFWPLYHIENDVWTLDYDPKDRKLPITEWLKTQQRFRHLFKPENAEVIKAIQEHVDKDWEKLKKQCGVT